MATPRPASRRTSKSRSRKSKKSSGTPELPRVFLNRSLGRHGIAEALRAEGFEVICLHEAFPDELRGDRTPDPVWIKWAAKHDCVIFSKDSRLNRGDNLRAVCDSAARAFILPKAHWTEAQQIERFVKHKYKIARIARKPGPYIYRVYNERPEREQIDC